MGVARAPSAPPGYACAVCNKWLIRDGSIPADHTRTMSAVYRWSTCRGFVNEVQQLRQQLRRPRRRRRRRGRKCFCRWKAATYTCTRRRRYVTLCLPVYDDVFYQQVTGHDMFSCGNRRKHVAFSFLYATDVFFEHWSQPRRQCYLH